jgi:hypothetical protein
MPASTSYFLPGVVFVPPPLSSVFYCVIICLCCSLVCSVCSGAIQNFNYKFKSLVFKSGRYLANNGMGVVRYRYRLINCGEHCLFILSFIAQFNFYCFCMLEKYLPSCVLLDSGCLASGVVCCLGSGTRAVQKLILIFNLKFYLSEFIALITLL